MAARVLCTAHPLAVIACHRMGQRRHARSQSLCRHVHRRCPVCGMGRYSGVGMPKPKKKKVCKVDPAPPPPGAPDDGQDEQSSPQQPPCGARTAPPPPEQPPSPGAVRILAVEEEVAEMSARHAELYQHLKGKEKEVQTADRVFDATVRAMDKRRRTDSATVLDKPMTRMQKVSHALLLAHWKMEHARAEEQQCLVAVLALRNDALERDIVRMGRKMQWRGRVSKKCARPRAVRGRTAESGGDS